MDNAAAVRRLSPEVRTALAVFQETYKSAEGPFAISDALAAVRRLFPALDVSDNELTRAIAAEAAATRLHVSGQDNPTEETIGTATADDASGDVRAAIAAFLRECQKEAEPFAAAEALGAVRRMFPALRISDEELTDAIAREANAAGFDIEYDASGSPRQLRMKALEEWDNEGGASKPANDGRRQ